jgi:opacity protein-like surface antigen
MKVRTLSTTIAALLASAAMFGPANAADMPVKGPVYKAAVSSVTDWSGLYIGVHGGGGWGEFRGTYDDVADFGPMDRFARGGVAGGQIGYRWQFGRAIWGVEIDASWANLKGRILDNEGDTRAFKTRSLSSARLVTGVAVDNIMLFSTIGVGYAQSKFTVTGGDAPSPASQSLNAIGLASSLGAEWMFAPNWSLRGEYMYYYFGKKHGIAALTTDSDPTDFVRLDGIHVARAALNYRLGGTGTARPITNPTSNWAGFYIGAHGGYGFSRMPGGYDEVGDHGSFSINPRGAVGGGQFGYNWQAGAWVYGIEVDGTWGGIKKSRIDGDGDTQKLETNALASARLRVGGVMGDTLVYLTGGVGFARSALTVTGTDTPSPAKATFNSWGAVFGGGADWALTPNWSVRVEGLTYFFDHKTGLPNLTSDSDPQDYVRQSVVKVVRAGVNYRF